MEPPADVEEVQLLAGVVLVDVATQVVARQLIDAVLDAPQAARPVEGQADLVAHPVGEDLAGVEGEAAGRERGEVETPHASARGVGIHVAARADADVEAPGVVEGERAGRVAAAGNVAHHGLGRTQVRTVAGGVGPAKDGGGARRVERPFVDRDAVVETGGRGERRALARAGNSVAVGVEQHGDPAPSAFDHEHVAVGRDLDPPRCGQIRRPSPGAEPGGHAGVVDGGDGGTEARVCGQRDVGGRILGNVAGPIVGRAVPAVGDDVRIVAVGVDTVDGAFGVGLERDVGRHVGFRDGAVASAPVATEGGESEKNEGVRRAACRPTGRIGELGCAVHDFLRG